jgi:SAM-dependent methyltransferase
LTISVPPSDERPTVSFDDHVSSYHRDVQDSIAFSGQEAAYFHQRKAEVLLEVTERMLGAPARLSALDVGCGVGSVDRFLAGRFGQLCGVDSVPAAVTQGATNHPEVTYLAGDGMALPFAPATFDLAFAVCVVHHVPPPHRRAFAAEVARVVRPGGLFVLFEHNALNPLTRLAVSRCEFDEGVVLLTRRQSNRLLTGAGLTAAETGDIIFTPFDTPWARRLDGWLGAVPFGAQHYVAARQP